MRSSTARTAIIITGGKDVDAALYGEEPHPENDAPRTDRDAWEDALLTAAIDRGVPFLGICRGMQLLNVVARRQPRAASPGRDRLQPLQPRRGQLQRQCRGSRAGVQARSPRRPSITGKSYHHQGIKRVGDGLVVTARSDDGIVQAIEFEDNPYGIAVQWHPEQDAEEDARLFTGLVDAAREYADNRKAHA